MTENKNATGFVLEFTYDFFCKNDTDIELIFHNSLFCHFAMNETIRMESSESVASGKYRRNRKHRQHYHGRPRNARRRRIQCRRRRGKRRCGRRIGGTSGADRIRVLDDFLIQKPKKNENKYRKVTMMSEICRTVFEGGEKFDGFGLSQKFNVSERYIQKLFLENVGLSPASLFSVTRFNRSLNLVLSSNLNLTSAALDCGYYDQAHFIKEFKKFTCIKPSEARLSLVKNGEDFQQAVNIGF